MPTKPIQMRLTAEDLTVIDELAARLSVPGMSLTRSDAVRVATRRHLETIAWSPQKKTSKKSRTTT